MDPSSTLCRTQEAYQRDRATNAVLDNVRRLAAKAADAWGMEAVAAERREARRERTRIIADMAKIQDGAPSENPDRGFATS